MYVSDGIDQCSAKWKGNIGLVALSIIMLAMVILLGIGFNLHDADTWVTPLKVVQPTVYAEGTRYIDFCKDQNELTIRKII